MKFFLAFFLSLVCTFNLHGQSEHFSDLTLSALLVNPAMTGAIPSSNANSRLTFNTRNQWSSFLGSEGFRTLAASYEYRLCDNQKYGFFSWGAHFVGDWQGNPALKRNTAMGSFSYTMVLGKAKNNRPMTTLSAGVEVGGIFYSTDTEDFTFDDQIGNTGIPAEVVLRDQFSFLDLGAGINVAHELRSKKNAVKSLFLSAAVKHINRQEAGFFDNLAPNTTSSDSTSFLPRRFNVLAGFTVGSDKNELDVTGAYYRQRQHNQFMARLLLHLRPSTDKTYFALGAGYRVNNGVLGIGSESLLAVVQLRSPRSIYSLNLDINTSSLIASTNGLGAVEVSAAFLFGEGAKCIHCAVF